jgi:hypothetical protein
MHFEKKAGNSSKSAGDPGTVRAGTRFAQVPGMTTTSIQEYPLILIGILKRLEH